MDSFFQQIEVSERIRDPLYGFIYLTDSEKKIIDTPIFQRLRRVHQLALTKYVYPSAEHSRFVHSLGVMHCATLILAGIFENKNSDKELMPRAQTIKTLRFAALLHDVGHLPFSHAVEKSWLGKKLSHEDLSRFIIEKYEPIAAIIRGEGIKPSTVSSLLTDKPLARYRLLHEIISGHLDADRADYLLRDSHACGVKYGQYDFFRFLQMFAVQYAEEGESLMLGISESDIHVAEAMLIARYHYFMQVPLHRTRHGYDEALIKFMNGIGDYKDIFIVNEGEDQIESVDFERFSDLDDYQVTELAKSERRAGNPWADYVLRSKHLAPLVDTRKTWDQGLLYKQAIANLSEQLVDGEDFFARDKKVEILKGYYKPIEETEGEVAPKKVGNNLFKVMSKGAELTSSCVDITERSWIIKQLVEEPETIYRIFVTEDKKQEALNLLKLER